MVVDAAESSAATGVREAVTRMGGWSPDWTAIVETNSKMFILTS